MKYRREIDGLRAIAVVPVILFHAGFSWFSGGYVGVDVFFVISGYLITALILDDLKKNTFSIARFYERRARRILPALVAVLLACTPFAWMWLTPAQLQDFSQGLVAISLFASNVLFWLKTNYSAPSAEENPLLHTWSLAVEEQFYVVFPLLMLFLWRHTPRHILTIILALSTISLLSAEWSWRQAPSANFYLLPTRAWELGAGAACALLLNKRPQPTNAPLAALGIGLILYAVFVFDDTVPFPSLYALVPVGGAVLITLFATPSTLTGRILSTPILVGIGLVSFSAYLWHQPLFAFARIRSPYAPSWVIMGLLSLLALGLAYLTWRYVEQPFRRKPVPLLISRRAVFRASGLAGLILLSSGLYGHIAKGLPDRFAPSGHSFLALDVDNRIRFNSGLSNACENGFLPELCRTGKDPEIMLWGDSFAMHLAQALVTSRSMQGLSMVQFTKPVCAPIYGLALTSHKYPISWSRKCIAFNERVKAWMLQNKSVKYVIMSSPLGVLYHDVYLADGEVQEYPHDTELVIEHLNRTAEQIRQAGKIPVFVSPPPRTDENLARCITASMVFAGDNTTSCSFQTKQFSPYYRQTKDLLDSGRIMLPIVDLEPYLCSDGTCYAMIGGKIMYRDQNHFSTEGSAMLGTEHDLLGDILLSNISWSQSSLGSRSTIESAKSW